VRFLQDRHLARCKGTSAQDFTGDFDFEKFEAHNSPADSLLSADFDRLSAGFVEWLTAFATDSTVRHSKACLRFVLGCMVYYKLVSGDLRLNLLCSKSKCQAIRVHNFPVLSLCQVCLVDCTIMHSHSLQAVLAHRGSKAARVHQIFLTLKKVRLYESLCERERDRERKTDLYSKCPLLCVRS